MRIMGRVALGLIAMCAGIFGGIYAVNASIAQAAYYELKYGSDRSMEIGRVMDQAEVSVPRYPHNYYLSEFVAEQLWHALPQNPDLRNSARIWCDRGLLQHPYLKSLRYLDVQLLALDNIDLAAQRWEAYVDWHYWDAHNHALLADLYARAGRFTKASESISLIKGSRHHAWAARQMRNALMDEMRKGPSLPETVSPDS